MKKETALKLEKEVEKYLSRVGPSTSVEIYNYVKHIFPRKYGLTISELSKFVKMKCKLIKVVGKKRGYNIYSYIGQPEGDEKYILQEDDAIWVIDERI